MPSDIELVESARSGDVHAFEQLVHRYDTNVLSLAARFGNSNEDAKDIYQEVFLRVFRNLHRFEGRSEFSTWLYRITTNVCLTFRSQKRKDHLATSEYNDDDHRAAADGGPMSGGVLRPDHHAESREISARISKALERLSPQQKLVFVMKHYEGYKLREIARLMGCAEGTVKRYMFAATRRMRVHLYDLKEILS